MSSDSSMKRWQSDSRRCASDIFPEVPVEIWQHIFQLVCRDSLQEHLGKVSKTSEEGQPDIHAFFTPFTLSHVCRYWYDAIISQTLVWRNILVHARTRAPDKLLKLWLTRTGSQSLFLWVDAHEDHPSMSSCLQTVRRVHSRWEKISLQFNEAEWAKQRMNLLKVESDTSLLSSNQQVAAEYASLKVLEAALHCGLDDDQDDLIFRFQHSENVHTLKLGECRQCLPHSTDYILYPRNLSHLPSVVNLTLTSQFIFPLVRFLNTLASIPNLQSLELHHCTLNIPSSPLHRTVIPHLQHLSVIDWENNAEVGKFFQCVTLPSLTSIIMTPSLHTPNFLQMTAVSKCQLKHFNLTTTHVSFHILVAMLGSEPFHHLQEFSLTAPSIGSDVLRFLSDLDYELANKNLEHISLIRCTSEDGVIAGLVMSRMKLGILRHLHVEVPDSLEDHPQDVDAIERSCRAGLDASLQA